MPEVTTAQEAGTEVEVGLTVNGVPRRMRVEPRKTLCQIAPAIRKIAAPKPTMPPEAFRPRISERKDMVTLPAKPPILTKIINMAARAGVTGKSCTSKVGAQSCMP